MSPVSNCPSAFPSSQLRLFTFAVLAGLSLKGQAAENPADARRPNIVLILTDDQGIADLGRNPHATPIRTPHLDRLAERGVRFSDHYACSSMCTPSRAGILTGRYPQRLGIYSVADAVAGFPRDVKLAPGYLKGAGYQTALIGKWHLGGTVRPWSRPGPLGFDRFWWFEDSTHDYFNPAVGEDAVRGYITYSPVRDQDDPIEKMDYLTREITAQSVEFIEKNKDQPFFLYVSQHCPHVPLQVPKAVHDRYTPLGLGRNATLTRAMYEILDDSVGEIVAALERNNLRENTLIIFSSDNGGGVTEAQLNWPFRGGKFSFLEGGIRVPAIMSWPKRLPENVVYRNPVINVDYLPTMFAAAGLKPEPIFDGVNLLPYLRADQKDAPHDALYFSIENHVGWAIRAGDWKLVYTDLAQGLYNLKDDPRELNDLRQQQPERVAQLKAQYHAWAATNKPSVLRDPAVQAEVKRIRAESKNDPIYQKMNVTEGFGAKEGALND
jgi:arylsulfatase A-like enzyme